MTEPGTNLVDRLGSWRPRRFDALGVGGVVKEGQLWRGFPEVPRAHSDEADPARDGHLCECVLEQMHHRLGTRHGEGRRLRARDHLEVGVLDLERDGEGQLTLGAAPVCDIVGEAVDICVLIDGKANWGFENYRKVADVFKACAEELGVTITWGGDWVSFKDGPHFQIEKQG